jgi:hypothetical protein
VNEWLDKMQARRAELGERASVRDVLWRLARRSKKAQRLPLRVTSATLWLSNGQSAHGVVLHVDDSQHLVSIVSNDGTLTLLPLNGIAGVSVHDMDAWSRPPNDVEVKSKLELSRAARALSEACGVAVDIGAAAAAAAEDDGARLLLQLQLVELEACWREIVAVEAGKDAWATLSKVVLHAGDGDVVREGTELRVGSSSIEQLWLAPELQHEIEKLL